MLRALAAILLTVFLLSWQTPPAWSQTGDRPPPRVDAHGDPLPEFARARLGTTRFRHGTPVASLRFAPDGQTLLSINENGLARVWETATGKEQYHFPLPDLSPGDWLLTPDHRMLITWVYRHSLRLWETRTGKLLRKFTSTEHRLGPAHLTPDGKTLLAVAIEDATDRAVIRLWDLATGKELRDSEPSPPAPGQEPFQPSGMSFVAGGKVLGAAGVSREGYQKRLWDFASGKELPINDTALVEQIHVLSPDGRVGAAKFPDGEKGWRLWLVDVATGTRLRVLDGSEDEDIRVKGLRGRQVG